MLWNVNPIGALLLFRSKGLQEYLKWFNGDFLAFTDGTWSISDNGEVKARIGGCILTKESQILYIFSGPIKANSPREAELKAILFIYVAFSSQATVQGRLQINSDCLSLVHEFQKRRLGHLHEECMQRWQDMINNPNFTLKYCPREELVGAHGLAVDGISRTKLLHAWCYILLICQLIYI